MPSTTRAVYRSGQLQLLENIALNEGQEVQFIIVDDHEALRASLR